MLTGVTEAWTVLIILFVAAVVVFRVRWTVAALLFLFGPFVGTLMTLLAQMIGQIGKVQRPDFLWLLIGVYALDYPYLVGLHSAVLATVLLILYSRYESSLDRPSTSSSRLILGLLIGAAIGALFATLILLSAWITNQNPEFIDFISGGTRDRLDPSTELLLSVCTGSIDGALIAILGTKCFRQKRLDGAVASATT